MAGEVENCGAMYPVTCSDETVSFSTCSMGLIACDSGSGNCPFFFKDGASQKRDQLAGVMCLSIALGVILVSLFLMVKFINKMLITTPVEVIAKMTNHNASVFMLIGCGSGMLFTSASVAESSIMPFVATGILELEQMFPWCLGMNFGLSFTNMLLAWSSGSGGYLQVAVANVLFNVIGTIMWYPIPYLREFPLHGALIVGIITRTWRLVCVVYVAITFILVPLTILGIGNLIHSAKKVNVIFGWIFLASIGLVTLFAVYSWFCLNGRERFVAVFEESREGGDEEYDRDHEEMSDDESYDDEYTNRSDVSSIGFEEPRPRQSARPQKSLNKVRQKAPAPPKARNRLVKNVGMSKEENCCCTDQILPMD